MHKDTVKEGGHSMTKESGQLIKSSFCEEIISRWVDSDQSLPLSPANLIEKFAAQMEIFPGTIEWIVRFSAQTLAAIFYMTHLDDYKRMLETDYPEGWKLDEVRHRDSETEKWIAEELPKNLENLSQRIETYEQYEMFYDLLANTRHKIIRRQKDYNDFNAQLSFFDEPKKFLLWANDFLGHKFPISGRGEWTHKGNRYGCVVHMVQLQRESEPEEIGLANT